MLCQLGYVSQVMLVRLGQLCQVSQVRIVRLGQLGQVTSAYFRLPVTRTTRVFSSGYDRLGSHESLLVLETHGRPGETPKPTLQTRLHCNDSTVQGALRSGKTFLSMDINSTHQIRVGNNLLGDQVSYKVVRSGTSPLSPSSPPCCSAGERARP